MKKKDHEKGIDPNTHGELLNQNSYMQKKFEITQSPPLLSSVQSLAGSTSDLDSVMWELGASASLFNIHFAFPIDYSHLGLGEGIFIPTMISRECGGRRSVLNLPVGDRVLTGMLVTSKGMALRYWTRQTGCLVKAQIRDNYREEWINRDGDVVITGFGTVDEVDHAKGTASIMLNIKLPDINLPPMRCKCRVIAWSLICWCDCVPEKTTRS